MMFCNRGLLDVCSLKGLAALGQGKKKKSPKIPAMAIVAYYS